MDGFGLAMFLPMLEMVGDNATASADKMGNLAFLVRGIEALGFSMSLEVVLATLMFFFSLKGILVLAGKYLNVVYNQFFIKRVRILNIQALANFSYYNFVSADAGRIQNTLSGEIERVNNSYKQYIATIQQTLMVVTYGFLAFLSNPKFALMVAIGGFITNGLFKILFKKTKRISRELTKKRHGYQGLLIQQVAYFKYLKASGMMKTYIKKVISKVNDIEYSQKQIGLLTGLTTGIREPILIAVVSSVIFVEVKIFNGSLSLIILSILFFYRALNSIMQVQTAYNSYLGLIGSLENVQEFYKELQSGKDIQGEKSIDKFKHNLKLNKVSFSYGNTSILEGVDLEIKSNKTVALVGESGSGKTTLMNLLSGLLKPSEGLYEIDGISLADLNLKDFQKRIGYITQEPVIFDDTVFNNVTFWDEPN